MIQNQDEANSHLKEGEFEKAKLLFSNILDQDPENLDLIAGYYIASYWDNRLEKIFLIKEGKERGIKLDELFTAFEKEYFIRKYPKNESFYAIQKCILSESCSQIRLGYHSEGDLDQKTVWLLCRNLLKIRDFRNTIEMIDYCKKKFETPPEFYYYKAESLYHIGEEKKSRLLFRSTLLHFPELLPLEEIQSEPLETVIHELSIRYSDKDELKEILPVYCMERGIFPEVADYTRDDVNHFYQEMLRLEDSLQNNKEDIQFKIKCRILQFGLTILDTFHGQLNSDLIKKVRDKLFQFDPAVLERRDSNRRGKEKRLDFD